MLSTPKSQKYPQDFRGDVTEFYREWWRFFQRFEGPFYQYGEITKPYSEARRLILDWVKILGDETQKAVVTITSKSPEAYASIWAFVFTNQVWTPVSPEVPWERMKAVLEASKAEKIVLDQPGFLPLVETWAKEKGAQVYYLTQFSAVSSAAPRVVEAEAVLEVQKDWEPKKREAGDICYLLFTSGSTGKPKGVPISHANLIPFLKNMFKVLDLESADVFADIHDWAFDISIFYLFCAPLCGAAISPARTASEKKFPMELVRKNRVSVWATVPSTIHTLQALRPDYHWPNTLRVLFICGEVFTIKTMQYIQKYLAPQKLFNFYGLTETAVENFFHECTSEDVSHFSQYGIVPIGKPLPENEYKIDQEGLLWLASPQVFEGYLDPCALNPTPLQSEKWQKHEGKTWFCTGDIVELCRGEVLVRGRADHQVKLNGYRIELGDIEVQLEKTPGIARAVCLLVSASGGLKKLVAAIQIKPDGSSEKLEKPFIRSELKAVLPEYMIPRDFYFFDEFPLNSSGKIDRGALLQKVLQKNEVKSDTASL